MFGLEGFLPYDVHSLEKQALRAYNQLLKVSFRYLPRSDEEANHPRDGTLTSSTATLRHPETRFPGFSERSKPGFVLQIDAGSFEGIVGYPVYTW